MPQGGARRPHRFVAHLLLWAVSWRGADVPALYRAVGFDPATGPNARVPIRTAQQLEPLIAEASAGPHPALHLGRLVSLASAGTFVHDDFRKSN